MKCSAPVKNDKILSKIQRFDKILSRNDIKLSQNDKKFAQNDTIFPQFGLLRQTLF